MNFNYRKGWKWKLAGTDYVYSLPASWHKEAFYGKYLELENGKLRVKLGYGWDGASGPAIDTENFMRGSMVHDALYEIIGILGAFKLRKSADEILVQICKEDGMTWARRQWVYRAVRLFGGKYVKKRFEDLNK